MRFFFHELDIKEIMNMVVIIDIDATLTDNSSFSISPEVSEKISRLSKHNRVLLLSNKKSGLRNKLLAEKLKVECIETKYCKPNKKILQNIDNLQERPIIVIGNKFLTDGFFTKSIGAKFIKIKRITSPQENIVNRLTYLIDDVLSRIFI
jgi:predicted HAD superfamily phosphohydrolase YqeG